MEDNLSLQRLIDAVKKDLISKEESIDPLFFVEKLEIEVAVKITSGGNAGINIQLFQAGSNLSREQADRVKVTLSPILSIEEQRKLLSPEQEEKIKERISVLRKESSVAGQDE